MTEQSGDLGSVLRDHLAQWRLRADGPIPPDNSSRCYVS